MDSRWMWNLNDILEGTEAFDALLAETEKKIVAMNALEGKVSEDPRAAVKLNFEIAHCTEKLYVYAKMQLDQDGGNAEAQTLLAKAQAVSAKAMSAGSFLKPELLAMDEKTLSEMRDDPAFNEYSCYMDDVLRDKPHTLPAEQEKLMAMAADCAGASSEIFSMLSDVDMVMPEVTDDEGKKVRLSHALYGSLIRSRNREVRKEAWEGMMNAYAAYRQTIAAAYRYSVKNDAFFARARRFDSAREASLFGEQIPVKVYDSLIESVHSMIPALNDYLALRKKTLGVDELHMYDLYVPMADGFDMKMSYPEAFELVKKGLKPLGEHYAKLLDEAYADGWIDVYENKGKHSGAYSWGVYGVHPYVLLNFTGDLSGAMTLAHELGHAMHSWHSDHALPFAKAGYSLFVAEVASTCNEMLLMRSLLKEYENNREASVYLMNQLLEEFRGTVYRQTMFAEFERESHRMEEAGEPLTAESLSTMNEKLDQLYYGGVCKVDEAVRWEWMRIPHYYNAFYVYKYATGFSAAVYIANRIMTEGQKAVDDYMKFLSAGGSMPPLDALRLAGVDMEDPATVQDALKVFADTVRELTEKLA